MWVRVISGQHVIDMRTADGRGTSAVTSPLLKKLQIWSCSPDWEPVSCNVVRRSSSKATFCWCLHALFLNPVCCGGLWGGRTPSATSSHFLSHSEPPPSTQSLDYKDDRLQIDPSAGGNPRLWYNCSLFGGQCLSWDTVWRGNSH